MKSRRPPRIPLGAWPAEMQAETAAGYCDEPSVEAFQSKVACGEYPQPCRRAKCLPKWHRAKLDQALAHRHNLAIGTLPVAEDLTGLI